MTTPPPPGPDLSQLPPPPMPGPPPSPAPHPAATAAPSEEAAATAAAVTSPSRRGRLGWVKIAAWGAGALLVGILGGVWAAGALSGPSTPGSPAAAPADRSSAEHPTAQQPESVTAPDTPADAPAPRPSAAPDPPAGTPAAEEPVPATATPEALVSGRWCPAPAEADFGLGSECPVIDYPAYKDASVLEQFGPVEGCHAGKVYDRQDGTGSVLAVTVCPAGTPLPSSLLAEINPVDGNATQVALSDAAHVHEDRILLRFRDVGAILIRGS